MLKTSKPRNFVAKDLMSGKYRCKRERSVKDFLRSAEKLKSFKEIRQYA